MIVLSVIFIVWMGSAQAADTSQLLSKDEVWILVANTPIVLHTECRGGCPGIELIPEGQQLMFAHIRNECPNSGSGMLANYTIDRRSGMIWSGTDTKVYIDSERLRRLRQVFIKGRR